MFTSIIFYMHDLSCVAVVRVSPSRYTRRSDRRFSLSVSVLVLHPRPRAAHECNCAKRDYRRTGKERASRWFARRKILERSCVREHQRFPLPLSPLRSPLFLSCSLRELVVRSPRADNRYGDILFLRDAKIESYMYM